MTLKGSFQITNWQESVDQELENGAKLSTAIVQQNYSGDVTGTSEARYQMCYDSSGEARFVGFETITLSSGDVLVLQHQGTFKQGVASSEFTIVTSYNNKTLLGKNGSFASTEGGQADYHLES